MFKIGDTVLYPLHGAGVVQNIEEKEILGEVKSYYVLKIPISDMTVMVPVDADVGIRSIVDAETAKNVISKIGSLSLPPEANWNQRFRDNMTRLKSGDMMVVASVVKSLLDRDLEKGLSTSERKMLMSAKQVLVSEAALATGENPQDIEKEIYKSAGVSK